MILSNNGFLDVSMRSLNRELFPKMISTVIYPIDNIIRKKEIAYQKERFICGIFI